MTDDEGAMTIRLVDLCRERNFRIAGDLAVPEAAAESLLGLSRGTLRKRYSLGILNIPYRREGVRRWYRLADLARVLLER
ncbi:hypothetical protein BTH42_22465 [Burkholderia sp. SRS-W-2-2016]|uniref:hypothetical protein n=1 Tax=Burkholderia sp. SRS-W-2-2016 TaxID=1926878 RepID=UPI00094B4636|nr:hypothetical protein [Burkholderia sp. SRS-W-2-2016]OLL29497.1 hypothetical protein BTH42_22465 [Burkholderia sp. SRS-W-2-2016]